MNELLYTHIIALCGSFECSLEIVQKEMQKEKPDLDILREEMSYIKKFPHELDHGIVMLRYLHKQLKKKKTQLLFKEINDLYKLE